MSNYGFEVRLQGGFDDVVAKVTDALQEEGFGVLSDIDVQATLKKRLDVDRRPYRILGACNPPLAHRALETEPDIGLLLPCNVVVREEDDGSTVVAFMDPHAVLSIVQREELAELGMDVKQRLERVRDAISA